MVCRRAVAEQLGNLQTSAMRVLAGAGAEYIHLQTVVTHEVGRAMVDAAENSHLLPSATREVVAAMAAAAEEHRHLQISATREVVAAVAVAAAEHSHLQISATC